MKLAPKADKKVIEKVLRLAEKKHQIDSSLKRTILPDARDSVEKWLMSANEDGKYTISGSGISSSDFVFSHGSVCYVCDLKRKKDERLFNQILVSFCKNSSTGPISRCDFFHFISERRVAVNFFNSLSGSKLMGQTATEQKKRLQQVIDTLEK